MIRRNRGKAPSPGGSSKHFSRSPSHKKETITPPTFCQTTKHYGLNSTPHGLFYIAEDGRPHLERMLWVVVTILAMLFTAMQTMQLYSDWKEDPVVTSLETVALPIERIEFPAVTICPQGSIKDVLESVLFKQFKEYIHIKTKGDLELSDLTKDQMLIYAESFLNETYPGAEEMPTKMIQAMTSTDPEKSVQTETLLNQEATNECDPATNADVLEVLKKELKNELQCPNGFDLLEDKSCVHRSFETMTYHEVKGYCDGMQGANVFMFEKIEDLEAVDSHEFSIQGMY